MEQLTIDCDVNGANTFSVSPLQLERLCGSALVPGNLRFFALLLGSSVIPKPCLRKPYPLALVMMRK